MRDLLHEGQGERANIAQVKVKQSAGSRTNTALCFILTCAIFALHPAPQVLLHKSESWSQLAQKYCP